MVEDQITTAMPANIRGGVAVSTYHLHARLVEGPPSASGRDELRTFDTDSRADADTWFREQLDLGFTSIAGASDYRMVAHSRPTRASADSACSILRPLPAS